MLSKNSLFQHLVQATSELRMFFASPHNSRPSVYFTVQAFKDVVRPYAAPVCSCGKSRLVSVYLCLCGNAWRLTSVMYIFFRKFL